MLSGGFRHTGPYGTLRQTWNAIHQGDWLPTDGAKPSDENPYEVCLDDKHKTPPDILRVGYLYRG